MAYTIHCRVGGATWFIKGRCGEAFAEGIMALGLEQLAALDRGRIVWVGRGVWVNPLSVSPTTPNAFPICRGLRVVCASVSNTTTTAMTDSSVETFLGKEKT